MKQSTFTKSTARNFCNRSKPLRYLSIDGINGSEPDSANYSRFIRKKLSLRKKKPKSGRKSKSKSEKRTLRNLSHQVWVWASLTRSTNTWTKRARRKEKSERGKSLKKRESFSSALVHLSLTFRSYTRSIGTLLKMSKVRMWASSTHHLPIWWHPPSKLPNYPLGLRRKRSNSGREK